MADDRHFIVNFSNFKENNGKDEFISPSQNLHCERGQYSRHSSSFSRSFSKKFEWTWKCWARDLLNEICLAGFIKRFTILLFLFCAIVFFVIIMFGDFFNIMQSSEKFHLPVKIAQDLQKSKGVMDSIELKQKEMDKFSNYFRQELFLVNPGDNIIANKDIDKQLEIVFHRIDSDNDNRLDVVELEGWIQANVQKHLSEDLAEKQQIFKFLDNNNDGLVCWKEYFQKFLKSKGHSDLDAEKHSEDYESIHMETREKDQLIRQKVRWSSVDRPPRDNCLNMEELNDFRHPEQSRGVLELISNDMMTQLDRDMNGFLSEYEFSNAPNGDNELISPGALARSEKLWHEERRLEFRQIVDLDNDGLVTKEELLKYVDPRNPSHSRNEARHLLDQADTNKDSALSLDEMLSNKDLILGSKIMNVAANFHDEF